MSPAVKDQGAGSATPSARPGKETESAPGPLSRLLGVSRVEKIGAVYVLIGGSDLGPATRSNRPDPRSELAIARR